MTKEDLAYAISKAKAGVHPRDISRTLCVRINTVTNWLRKAGVSYKRDKPYSEKGVDNE